MLWPFIMLSILWQQSSSPRLFLLWRGISSAWFWTSIWLLGLCPNPWHWKSHWRINSNSFFLACKGLINIQHGLCQFRSGVLICSAIPVSLCTWGSELPLVLYSHLFQLCSLLFPTWNQSCTWHPQCYWPAAVEWFGLYSFLSYSIASLISAEHCDDISRHFSVITSRSFLCVVTVNSQTNTCTWN